MIERLHRYLTARLWCHAHEYWAEAVLLVFTGILNSRKKALETSSAELVYENPCIFRQYPSSNHSPTTPTLLTSKPGYFSTSEAPTLSASRHAKPRRRHIYGSNKNIARPPVKKNPILGALQSPLFGPCKVLRRDDTTDAIGVHGVATTVFVERLNLAYVIQH